MVLLGEFMLSTVTDVQTVELGLTLLSTGHGTVRSCLPQTLSSRPQWCANAGASTSAKSTTKMLLIKPVAHVSEGFEILKELESMSNQLCRYV